jgi:uncharacterized protein YciI
VDPGVHQLQGEAEGVTPTELVTLLQEFHSERLALVLRHQAVARHVGNLDQNNAYQYVVNREETHLEWIRSAIEELGGVLPASGREPELTAKGAEAVVALVREDAEAAGRFVTAWTPRTEQVSNARHRSMMRVVLGETLEQKRFFEQAAAGREDLLGRRMDAGPRRGAVIPTRWLGQ